MVKNRLPRSLVVGCGADVALCRYGEVNSARYFSGFWWSRTRSA
jgi:hypothetical protein